MPGKPASTNLPVNLENDKLNQAVDVCLSRLQAHVQALLPVEVGTVTSVSRGVVRLSGLPQIASEELVRFPHEQFGMAFNLDEREVGVILLDDSGNLHAGADARRTGRVIDVPVGNELIGRVIDPLGRPLDELGPVNTKQRLPC